MDVEQEGRERVEIGFWRIRRTSEESRRGGDVDRRRYPRRHTATSKGEPKRDATPVPVFSHSLHIARKGMFCVYVASRWPRTSCCFHLLDDSCRQRRRHKLVSRRVSPDRRRRAKPSQLAVGGTTFFCSAPSSSRRVRSETRGRFSVVDLRVRAVFGAGSFAVIGTPPRAPQARAHCSFAHLNLVYMSAAVLPLVS